MELMDDQKDSKVLSTVIWVVILAVIVYSSVTLYRRNQAPPPVKLELTESDRKELKDELEKIVREDLTRRKATKINSVEVSDPELPDAEHIVINYKFSYDDNSKEEGQVTHKMTATARLVKKADGWQIENVTPSEENLKFSTPLVIELAKTRGSP
jgi:hypothetical protein